MTLPQSSDKRVINIVTGYKSEINKTGKVIATIYREYFVDVDKTDFYLDEDPEFRSFRTTGSDAPTHYHVWVENDLVDHQWCKKCGKVRIRP